MSMEPKHVAGIWAALVAMVVLGIVFLDDKPPHEADSSPNPATLGIKFTGELVRSRLDDGTVCWGAPGRPYGIMRCVWPQDPLPNGGDDAPSFSPSGPQTWPIN